MKILTRKSYYHLISDDQLQVTTTHKLKSNLLAIWWESDDHLSDHIIFLFTQNFIST